jgi:hypothetical protein
MSNFSYCPLVWHFCGARSNDKIEKIHKRCLRIINRDYNSSYEDLLAKTEAQTILVSRLCAILINVFKCIQQRNPKCLNELYDIKACPYKFRRSIVLEQPVVNTTKFGLRSLKYIGSKMWNDLNVTMNVNSDTTIVEFSKLIRKSEDVKRFIESNNNVL